MNTKIKGYILACIAAATYGMLPLFALPLYKQGMNPDSVLFFRYLFAVPILGVMLKMRGRSFKVSSKELISLAGFGFVFFLSSLTLFVSYNYMDAGIASTILFVYPIMVALIMATFFKEKLTVKTILCLVLAVGGIGLLYKGADGVTLSFVGTLLALGSALAYAIYIAGVNRSVLKETPTIKVTFYVVLFGLIFFTIKGFGFGEITPPPATWYNWVFIFLFALIPTALSLLCTTTAVQYIGSTPTAILGALEPVTAIVIGVTLFGEQLTSRNIAGIIVIIAAVTIVVAGSNITKPLIHFRKLFPKILNAK